MSFCRKLKFCYPCILATRDCRPLIFQTLNFVRTKSLSLKYQRFMPLGCKDLWIRKLKFVRKTLFPFCQKQKWTAWHKCKRVETWIGLKISKMIKTSQIINYLKLLANVITFYHFILFKLNILQNKPKQFD